MYIRELREYLQKIKKKSVLDTMQLKDKQYFKFIKFMKYFR